MFWDKVLEEIADPKNVRSRKFSVTNLGLLEKNRPPKRYPIPRVLKSYDLGERHHNLYLTKREAECMLLLVKGLTIAKAAIKLKLSPRTLEYYLKNVKAKLQCRTKFELMEIIANSDFNKNIDFDI